MYAQIDANKRRTRLLIAAFTGVIIALGWGLGIQGNAPEAGIFIAVIITVIMNLVAYFKGDKVALVSAGAKQINKEDHRQLYLAVENLAITAGIPMPKVYVIEDASLNAFATGRDPEHASVAVTSGLLKHLNEQELEGVLAHELSHIQNYDIRVMTIVVVLVGAVLLLSDLLIRISFSGGNRDKGALPLALVGLALAILSPIFAQLIKLAISRSREYLADASGAMLTRYPEGLASALEKIAQKDQPMKRANHATAHLFLANPFDPHVTKKFESMFSTHPPIEERIQKLRNMA